MRTTARIGTSGYVYDHWDGAFYPEELPKSRWFDHYAERFGTVEINNTYYKLATEKVAKRWREQAPEGFTYAFKAHRYITHMKRLKDADEPLAKFFGALKPLQDVHAAILFQLPEHVPRDDARLRTFLRKLPHGWTHAFEFRHRSWFEPDVLDLLGEHGVAFCIHDWPGSRPVPEEATAKLVYLRFHGVERAYQGLYGPRRLARWVDRIERWRKGRHDVVAYFNNDERAFAARDAAWLAAKVEGRDEAVAAIAEGRGGPRQG